MDIALVLAGGGARGAYEVGALSELLPVLRARGEYPNVIVGTSVGALNAAYFAATADDAIKDLTAVLERAERIWLETGYSDVLRPIASPPQLARFVTDVFDLAGVPGFHFWSVFDPAPLTKTLHELELMPRIHANVEHGIVKVAGVVATAATTGRSVVFHDGGDENIPSDRWRGIDYVQTELREDHVRASAAIPAAFPAQDVTERSGETGWYFDGGTRLNTPIKPAITFGAEKIIVIALNSPRGGNADQAPAKKADGFDGLSQIIQAILVDPLVNDMKTLTTINRTIKERTNERKDSEEAPSEERPDGKRKKQLIDYIFVAPQADEIGQCAADVYKKHYSGPSGAAHSLSLSLLGHTLDAGDSPVRGELFSYLFFASEFARELIELGRADAKAWLDQSHDDGPWRTGPLPEPPGAT